MTIWSHLGPIKSGGKGPPEGEIGFRRVRGRARVARGGATGVRDALGRSYDDDEELFLLPPKSVSAISFPGFSLVPSMSSDRRDAVILSRKCISDHLE